jgi:hypothetical protein
MFPGSEIPVVCKPYYINFCIIKSILYEHMFLHLLKGAFYTNFPLLEEDWVITKKVIVHPHPNPGSPIKGEGNYQSD